MTNFSYADNLRPFKSWKSITPSDGNDLDATPLAVIALGAGDIAMVDGDGNEIIIAVGASEVINFSPQIIKSTGTTASDIYALY